MLSFEVPTVSLASWIFSYYVSIFNSQRLCLWSLQLPNITCLNFLNYNFCKISDCTLQWIWIQFAQDSVRFATLQSRQDQPYGRGFLGSTPPLPAAWPHCSGAKQCRSHWVPPWASKTLSSSPPRISLCKHEMPPPHCRHIPTSPPSWDNSQAYSTQFFRGYPVSLGPSGPQGHPAQ